MRESNECLQQKNENVVVTFRLVVFVALSSIGSKWQVLANSTPDGPCSIERGCR